MPKSRTSTKIIVCLLAASLSACLTSCSKQAEIDLGSGVSRDKSSSAQKSETAVEFNAVYSRTDGYIEKKVYPYVTVIGTRAEIVRYTSENEGQYDFYTTFYDAVTAYDTAFFEEKSLIVIMLEEGSGSIRHEVAGIDYNSSTGESIVKINRTVPEEQTDDMAEWHILVEIDKDSPILDNPDLISVEITDVR